MGSLGAWSWAAVIAQLQRLGHRAMAVDLAGRGESPYDLAKVTLAVHIDTVFRYVEERGLRDVVMVGHSMAGLIMPSVAVRMPERIKRLIFISALVMRDGESAMEVFRSGGLGVGNRQTRSRETMVERFRRHQLNGTSRDLQDFVIKTWDELHLCYSLLFGQSQKGREVGRTFFKQSKNFGEVPLVKAGLVSLFKSSRPRDTVTAHLEYQDVKVENWRSPLPLSGASSTPPIFEDFQVFGPRLVTLQLQMREWRPRRIRDIPKPGYDDRFNYYTQMFALLLAVISTLGLFLSLIQTLFNQIILRFHGRCFAGVKSRIRVAERFACCIECLSGGTCVTENADEYNGLMADKHLEIGKTSEIASTFREIAKPCAKIAKHCVAKLAIHLSRTHQSNTHFSFIINVDFDELIPPLNHLSLWKNLTLTLLSNSKVHVVYRLLNLLLNSKY